MTDRDKRPNNGADSSIPGNGVAGKKRRRLNLLDKILLFMLSLGVLQISIYLFDIIFYTGFHNYIWTYVNLADEWLANKLWFPIRDSANRSGLVEFLSARGFEVFRLMVVVIVLVIAGGAAYHQRVAHRIRYGVTELFVAFLAMWIAIGGMAGGSFSLPYTVAFFSGLYIMIRGLQNIDEGLKTVADSERQIGVLRGPAQAWFEIWQALFYEPYRLTGYNGRLASIAKARQTIQVARAAAGKRPKGLAASSARCDILVTDSNNVPLEGADISFKLETRPAGSVKQSRGRAYIEVLGLYNQLEITASYLTLSETVCILDPTTRYVAIQLNSPGTVGGSVLATAAICPDGTTGQPCVSCVVNGKDVKICG